ncbi:MAG: ribonuclease P protein component [Clostridia bacterium]|nr:ribonuclease P protein component [Clostridia bacterium]
MQERRDERFPRRLRLGSNRNYRYVYRRGKSCPSRNLVLIHLKARDMKIGFSVSGKVGNAVTRNRIRRWLREDVRRMRTQMKCGKYVFIARQGIADVPHEALTRELERLIARARLLKEAPGIHTAIESRSEDM